jgi:hypothetical protein
VVLNASVSEELLVAIFQKGSPLHDGAVVIDDAIVSNAGAILPLTQRSSVPEEYGTRHRAAMGLADRSDAIVVVVSEERGTVTVMSAGSVRLMTSEQELSRALTVLSRTERSTRRRLSVRPATVRLLATSLGLAAAVWAAVLFFPGRSVRVQTVPLEFTDVPAGLSVAEQSASTIQIWLRGSDLAFETAGLQDIVARGDLSSARPGVNQIMLSGAIVDVPFGLRVDRIAPSRVSVRLTGAPQQSQSP